MYMYIYIYVYISGELVRLIPIHIRQYNMVYSISSSIIWFI